MKIISNVKVGVPDTSPSFSSHVKGVREGNNPNETKKELTRDTGNKAEAALTRSTGINAKSKKPIDPKMPTLTPA